VPSLATRLPLGLVLPQPKTPPDVPAGWRTGPPDFVGVGAQRCGTTWWWSLLSGHPGVVGDELTFPAVGGLIRSRPGKEFHFFDHYGRVADIDPAEYHRYFPRPPGRLTGEWTPRYMYDFWTPPMLHRVAPDARLLVMLRDPVARFASGTARWGGDPDPLLQHDQFARGRYWQQLRHLLEYFDRSRLLILQYERCVADPAGQLRRTFRFLGLPELPAPPETARRVGIVSDGAAVLDEPTAAALRRGYRADLHRLLADFPELDSSLWPSASDYRGEQACEY